PRRRDCPQPGDGDATRPRARRDPLEYEVRAGALPAELLRRPPGRASGPAGQRRGTGDSARPDLPHSVRDGVGAPAGQRRLPRPGPWRPPPLGAPPPRPAAPPGVPGAEPCPPARTPPS